jgi:putative sigma-54 modulation protein
LLFTISGKHSPVSEEIKTYAQEKTSKLPRYYDGINQVEVIVDGSHGANKAAVEIIARGEHGNVFVATHAGEELRACIDGALHKLEMQLRKKKTRLRDNKHTGGNSDHARPPHAP